MILKNNWGPNYSPCSIALRQVRYNTGAAGAVLSKVATEGGSLTIGIVGTPTATAAPKPATVKPVKPRVGGIPVPYKPSRKHAVQPIEWESREGKLLANGKVFKLKGGTCVSLSVCVRLYVYTCMCIVESDGN